MNLPDQQFVVSFFKSFTCAQRMISRWLPYAISGRRKKIMVRLKQKGVKMKHLRRCIPMFFLVAALIISMAVPAFAANESFSFTVVGDQTQTFKVYTGTSNVKTIAGNPATIMTDQNTTFPPDIPNWAIMFCPSR